MSKLVGMGVGVRAVGPQGCPFEAGAGHGDSDYDSSLPALACMNPGGHGITLKRSGGVTAYLWKRLGLWKTLGFMGLPTTTVGHSSGLGMMQVIGEDWRPGCFVARLWGA